MFAINKLHLVNEQKKFRTNYVCFEILRTRLRSKISIIDVLIIFNNKTLKNVKKQCKFVSNMRIFKTFLNRLEIYMQFNLIKYTKKYIKNLQYILLTQVKRS